MVWVVSNGEKLVQNRKTLSPAGLMDTSAVIRGGRDENRLRVPKRGGGYSREAPARSPRKPRPWPQAAESQCLKNSAPLMVSGSQTALGVKAAPPKDGKELGSLNPGQAP